MFFNGLGNFFEIADDGEHKEILADGSDE